MTSRHAPIYFFLLLILVGLWFALMGRSSPVGASETAFPPVSVSADKNGASVWVARGDTLYYYIWDGGHRLLLKGKASIGSSSP